MDSDYHVIFYPGGHGPMFDLPNNDEIAALTKTAYESGAIVSAVCHGIVGQIFLTLLLYIYIFLNTYHVILILRTPTGEFGVAMY